MREQLPKHVVFKGDNGHYMGAVTPPGEEHVFLQFYVYAGDKTDRRCCHTIHTNDDGTIRIKSDYYGKFWRLSPNWIWVDNDEQGSNNPDTLFRLVKLEGEGMYALFNVASRNYCHRQTYDGKDSCLNAASPSIHNEARLKMEEAVLSRRIYDVRYHTSNAKIHGEKLNTLITQEAVNRGSTANKETISLKYSLSRETKWDSTASIKFGVTTTGEAGIPGIVSGSVQLSTEFTLRFVLLVPLNKMMHACMHGVPNPIIDLITYIVMSVCVCVLVSVYYGYCLRKK